ncbi:MAG: hypothetical protein AB7F78_05710 [Hyphomicrobiaceae bacterium]
MSVEGRILGGFLVGTNALLLTLLFLASQSVLDAGQLLNFIGVLVSVFSFSAGAYFALLAVTAYGHARSVELLATEAQAKDQKIDKYLNRFSDLTHRAQEDGRCYLRFMTESVEVIAEHMASLDRGKAVQFNSRLFQLRCRWCFLLEDDVQRKMDRARDLIALGDQKDLERVLEFLNVAQHSDAPALIERIKVRMRDVT